MTELKKIVKRQLRRLRDRGRPVIVSLVPDVEFLVFRRKGERKTLSIGLEACWYAAAKIAAAEIRKAREARRKARREARR